MQTACAGRSGWFAHERRAAVGAGPAMDGWALDYARIYGRAARVGGVRVHARQPLLVALGADQRGDRQQPAELPVVGAGELEHDVARGRAEEAQQPDLEPRAVRRVLEVVGDAAEVAGEARDRR